MLIQSYERLTNYSVPNYHVCKTLCNENGDDYIAMVGDDDDDDNGGIKGGGRVGHPSPGLPISGSCSPPG